ncbi:MAG: methylated-DNA--[protein]-cysteine S-methyltransferase [Anaerolineae bacterium]|nr:methylated-DNA--[protein]-cysteine S-methyltransferase [Anaerolineae bacterium]
MGWLGIAWSERGLVKVTLPQPTKAEALDKLPSGGDAAPPPPPTLDIITLADRLRRYFDGEAVTFDEPLDPEIGTPFQRRVWAICRAIPRGETRTYGQIAREAGSPRAARAVGQAMARNPWPVFVPCHRVLGSDQSLTGYGGGLEMKRQLLVMEGAMLT